MRFGMGDNVVALISCAWICTCAIRPSKRTAANSHNLPLARLRETGIVAWGIWILVDRIIVTIILQFRSGCQFAKLPLTDFMTVVKIDRMTPEDFSDKSNALCAVCRLFGERQWCLATSGNFSTRCDDSHFLVTQSGKDKSILVPADLMICDLSGRALNKDLKPSAETPLHSSLYSLEADIGSILHTHSVASTVLSRSVGAELAITGFEMQKALPGIASHEESITIPVFENTQDMEALAMRVRQAWDDGAIEVPGFLVRGHGLYAWGKSLREAQRHTEGFEFLLECSLKEQQVRQT
jgi:methylthioribulose-1-phosphate dehydratase